MRAARLAPALLLAASGCIKPPVNAPWTPFPTPSPSAVDVAVFLVGDAGEGLPGRSPVLASVRSDVETWSEALKRPGAVNVLFLGDNVYPAGVRPRSDPSFPADSARLASQVDVVRGPAARRWGARAFFTAGNHDWGGMPAPQGLLRLQNEEALIKAFAEAGADVRLEPPAGRSGPVVVDAGSTVRFAFLDTHWWLQAGLETPRRDTVFIDTDRILQGAGNRALLFASHHPFASGGAHGGPMPFWRGLGILWLLRHTGALVQDLNSPIFKQYLAGLRKAFTEIRQPLVYAGGHDHSLQVIEQFGPGTPQWSLVSGSASKLTGVGSHKGMLYGAARPGYMRLFYRKDGTVDLQVVATTAPHQACGDDSGEGRPAPGGGVDYSACIEAGVASLETVFEAQLRGPRPLAPDSAGTGGGVTGGAVTSGGTPPRRR